MAMLSCSKLRIVLLFVLLHDVAGATVIYEARALSDSIADASVVAQVRISRVEKRRFHDGSRSASCGTDYVVDVLTTFKGEPRDQRTFTAHDEPHAVMFHEVKPGDELLVLLAPRQIGEGPAGGITDVIEGPPSRAEIECRAQLSSTTLLAGEAGGFPLIVRPRASAAGQKDVVWIAYNVVRTEMPKSLMHHEVLYNSNCTGLECTQAARRMLPWESLKAEIRRWLREAKQNGAGKN
jgi:hypothetical protein